MTSTRKRRFAVMIALVLLTLAIFVLSISCGSVTIEVKEVVKSLLGIKIDNQSHSSIITNIRLPRALATLVGGACLAISGLLLQIFFKNPIVEPYVLGISSGATLFVGATVLGGITLGVKAVTPMYLFIGAFSGSMVVMGIVVFAARRVKSITTLLIIGMMTGFLCSSLTSIMIAFADKEKVHGFLMWTMGSFSGLSWTQVKYMIIIGTPLILSSYMITKPLNALLLGEKYAVSLGVDMVMIQRLIVILASVMTAVVTAFTGPIAFIGLAVPHIMRLILKTSDSKILIPTVALGGAFMTGACDFCARMLMAPIELPLSSVTSLIGAPIVVYLLMKKENAL